MPDEDNLEPLFLFDDEPVRSHHEDALQLKGFSRTIAAAAIGSPGPFTIGIFAGWGQGKTSILRQTRALIDRAPNQQHAVTAWVNAWRFEQEEHPLVPIILSILNSIYKKLKDTNPANPQERFLSRVHRALRAIVYGFGFKGKIAVPQVVEGEVSMSAKDIIERFEKLAPQPDPLVEKSLYYHAYEILDGLLDEKPFKKPPYPKIVVFIDDLDRCLPDKALKVFESIKLVLSQRGFVFVLAVDRVVIDGFLTKRYRDDFGLSEVHHHGEQYMDKIIQLALHVPHHEGRFEEYILNLIAHKSATAPSLQGKLLKTAERKVFASLVKPLAAGTERNPRNLIRILNRLLTDKFLWDQLPADAKKGKGIQSADELLRFAAISRILENAIGIAHYRSLVRGEELCSGIRKFLNEFQTEGLFPSEKDRPILKGRSPTSHEQQVIEKIEFSPALREMLLSDSGQEWLEKIDKRSAVESFLDRTRSEANGVDAAILGQEALFSVLEGDHDNAEKWFKKAIAADAKHVDNLGNYATFLKNIRKDYGAAGALYRRAIQIDPEHFYSLGDYGQLLIGIGQANKGLSHLRLAWKYNDLSILNNAAEFAYSLWLGSLLGGVEEPVWERAFKYIILQGFSRHSWNFDDMLAQARKRFSEKEFLYASALAEAFLHEDKVVELEKFPRWQELMPLDPELVMPEGEIKVG